MTPQRRKTPQKKKTCGGNEKDMTTKKAGFSCLKEKSTIHTLKWYKQRGNAIKHI
jgi:hypothetical protein